TSVLFTPPADHAVKAAVALSASSFVVAEEGGLVQQLNQNNGAFEVTRTFVRLSTDVPDHPSALAVLETASGREVLVTNEGQDSVFVFGGDGVGPGVGPGGPVGPVGPSGVPLTPMPQVPASTPPSSESETTVLPDAPLVLVVTLVTGTLDAP